MLLQALCSISYPLVNWNWSYSPETPNLGQIWRLLELCDLEIWRMTLRNNMAPLLCHFKLCVSFHTHWWIQIWVRVRKRSIRVKIDDFLVVWPRNFADDPQQGKSEGFDSCDRPSNLKLDSNRQFFRPCDREIWWMISKNNRALLLYYVKLCASFQIHWWIQIGFTVQKCSIRVEIGDMLSHVTLKFDGWPWKTKGHLFYPTSSFVHHFVPIGEFKFELQSGNTQFGSNSTIFKSCVTSKFDGLPWKTIGHLFYATSSFVQHFIPIGEFSTGVTVRKRPIWVKFDDF